MKPIILGLITGAILAVLLLKYGVQTKHDYKPARKLTSVQEVIARDRERVQPIPSITHTPSPVGVRGETFRGKASFYTNEYCRRYNPSCRTASGQVFDDTKLTTACASHIPLGSTLRVSYADEVVLVECNDRGSFEKSYGRILDLSAAAFETLAPLSTGVIEVQVEIVK